MNDFEKELTEKEVGIFEFLKSDQNKSLVSNEDRCSAWIDDGINKVKIKYSTYLKFVYSNKIVCYRSDIDNCIFWHKAQDEENNWTNGIITHMPSEPGQYDVISETGTIGKSFCSHNGKGEMVWLSPSIINVWR